MKQDTQNLTIKAIKSLPLKNCYQFENRIIILACLLRQEDQRPLKASWWRGKEVSIIGADIYGNFILRHCGGSVRYWIHSENKEIKIAVSIKSFLLSLESYDEP